MVRGAATTDYEIGSNTLRVSAVSRDSQRLLFMYGHMMPAMEELVNERSALSLLPQNTANPNNPTDKHRVPVMCLITPSTYLV
ncbi:unnamed protein product [Merluccius merluccius]